MSELAFFNTLGTIIFIITPLTLFFCLGFWLGYVLGRRKGEKTVYSALADGCCDPAVDA